MGTNFYLRKKLSDKEKAKLYSYIDNEDWDSLKESIPEKIHIGKRSAGWKFLWNANKFKYFKPNKKSLMEFLKSGQIINEYGEEFTFDQFINGEIANFINMGWDMETYCIEENSSYKYTMYKYTMPIEKRIDFENIYKVKVNQYGEFYIGKLRFTTFDEFS